MRTESAAAERSAAPEFAVTPAVAGIYIVPERNARHGVSFAASKLTGTEPRYA